jgi:hypothetical protein
MMIPQVCRGGNILSLNYSWLASVSINNMLSMHPCCQYQQHWSASAGGSVGQYQLLSELSNKLLSMIISHIISHLFLVVLEQLVSASGEVSILATITSSHQQQPH